MEAAPDSLRRARPLLGTFVEIAASRAAPTEMGAAVEAAFGAVARVHRLMSFHDPASDVSRLNREAAAGAVAVDPWTFEVLRFAADLHRRSAGAFDIAVAPVLQRLGLLPAAEPDRVQSATSTGDAIDLLAGRRVRFRHPGVTIDLGGIAKGFAVDRAIAVLRDHQVPQGLVNAGGDLAVFGPEPQVVHVRNPLDPSRLLCGVTLIDEALASSATCLDLVQPSDVTSSAVIDPRTRRPIGGIKGATVCAPSCMTADALTKVVMIEGEAAAPLLDHYGASALIALGDDDVRVTSNWHANSVAA
jgi:thiamine biosynthesis lipoprotein